MPDTKSTITRLLAAVTAQPLLLLFLLPFGVVAVLNPVKIALVLYAVSKLALFAAVGDRVDTWVFRKLDDAEPSGIAAGTRWKRKAWIVCACIAVSALTP